MIKSSLILFILRIRLIEKNLDATVELELRKSGL